MFSLGLPASFALCCEAVIAKRFDVMLIQHQQSLFDIFAAAGGENIAIVKTYPATASSTGTVTIQFTTGAADQPKVSAIQIVNP